MHDRGADHEDEERGDQVPPRHDVVEEAARLERPVPAALVLVLGLGLGLGTRARRDGDERREDAEAHMHLISSCS